MKALNLGEHAPEDLIRELEHVAATALSEAYEPFAEAAFRLARSTEASRTTEEASVQRRAQRTAALVSDTTDALQERHERFAGRLAEEARTAARAAAASSVPGFKVDARRKANREADAVRRAAAARAEQRATAAALTAQAAEQAEARLAIESERAAVIVQRDALQAAATVRASALANVYEIAIDVVYRHLHNA
jgi:hypothetical protein